MYSNRKGTCLEWPLKDSTCLKQSQRGVFWLPELNPVRNRMPRQHLPYAHVMCNTSAVYHTTATLTCLYLLYLLRHGTIRDSGRRCGYRHLVREEEKYEARL